MTIESPEGQVTESHTNIIFRKMVTILYNNPPQIQEPSLDLCRLETFLKFEQSHTTHL